MLVVSELDTAALEIIDTLRGRAARSGPITFPTLPRGGDLRRAS